MEYITWESNSLLTLPEKLSFCRISSKVREDHDSLLDAELEQMLGGLSGSDMEDNMDGSKDDDDLILDIEEFVNS